MVLHPDKTAQKISMYLPRLGLCCLFICLGSGIILSFYYRPMGNVFRNVEEITTLVPFGKFFRLIHFGSGQIFVILMLIHTLDHFLKRRYLTYGGKEWTLLILSIGLCFFALFTGFVLKGDKEGLFAGYILMNILKTLPAVGKYAYRPFIQPEGGLFFLPFLYHCFFLPALILFLTRGHIREWFPDEKSFLGVTLGLFLFALIWDPSVDIPPDAPVKEVTGPWFFLGIQSLLKVLPPFFAGILIPGLFAVLVLLLPGGVGPLRQQTSGGKIRNYSGRVLHNAVMGLFLLYGLLTLRALLWGP